MKRLVLVLSVMLIIISFTGCSSDESKVKDVAEKCLTAMDNGDFVAIKDLCTDECYTNAGFDMFADLESYFIDKATHIGNVAIYNQSVIGDEATASINNLCSTLRENFINSYEISEVKMNEDGSAEVSVSAKYGYNHSAIDETSMMPEDYDLDKEVASAAADFIWRGIQTNGNTDANAAYAYAYDKEISNRTEIYEKEVMATGESPASITLHLTKIDNNWLVSDITFE